MSLSSFSAGVLVFTLVMSLVQTVRAQDQKGQPPSPASKNPSSNNPASENPAADNPSSVTELKSIITVDEGRLSVDLDQYPLDWVLDDISRKGEVAVIKAEGAGSRLVSIQFKNVPLDEGLRRILKDNDVFYFYGGEGEAPASLRALWVYPKTKGRGIQPVPAADWAATAELERWLGDPDPETRANAVGALIERQGDKARDALMKALQDDAPQVRVEALYNAVSFGLKLPSDMLQELALNDSSESVRFLALEGLFDDPSLGAIAEQVLNDDPSPQLKNKAQEILASIEARSTSRTPEPPAQSQHQQLQQEQ